MDLIPDEELKTRLTPNLTPLVDFLFLVVALFSVLAVTRTALFDSEVRLAKVAEAEALYPEDPSSEAGTVNLGVTNSGGYKWITEFNEYGMNDVVSILEELSTQKQLGLLPSEPSQIKIFLHVDQKAEWNPVIELIYRLRKTGYSVHPVYEKQ